MRKWEGIERGIRGREEKLAKGGGVGDGNYGRRRLERLKLTS